MTNATIDNSAEGFGKVILWQYDRAFNLLRVLAMMRSLYDAAVTGFWKYWCCGVLSIDECDDFGADMWAVFIGVVRPNVTIGGKTSPVSLPIYRRYLKASFYLMNSDCSIKALNEFYRILFPIGTGQKVYISDNFDMSINFNVSESLMTDEELAFFNQNRDDLTPHPLGVLTNKPVEEFVFGFSGQEDQYDDYAPRTAYGYGEIVKYDDGESGYIKWKCTQQMTAAFNSSWAVAKTRFVPTIEGDPIAAGLCDEREEKPYKPGISFKSGEIVVYNTLKYWCKSSVSAASNTSWNSVSGSFRVLLYQAGTAYDVGEIVALADGSLWLCVEKMYQSQNVGLDSEFKLHFREIYSRTTFICSETEKMSSMGEYIERQGINYLISSVPTLNSLSSDRITTYDEIKEAASLSDNDTLQDVINLVNSDS